MRVEFEQSRGKGTLPLEGYARAEDFAARYHLWHIEDAAANPDAASAAAGAPCMASRLACTEAVFEWDQGRSACGQLHV